MHKERECEEVATLDGDSYKFAGTFSFLRKLAFMGRDPAIIYNDLTAGKMPPEHIKNVLSCALESLNGDEVKDGHDEIIETFIENAGLQESAYVARVLLSHGMVGSVKKKQIRANKKVNGMKLED